MKALVVSIYEAMNNITLAFEGNLGKDNPEVAEMKNDVLYRDLPSFSEDRGNLKMDGGNAVNDLNTALIDYNTNHHPGAITA